MNQYIDSFYQLSSPEQIFWISAIVATSIFILILISTFLIGEIDADIDMDGGASFQFFTLKNAVAFFSIFGWVGISCLHNDMSLNWSITLAVLAGLAIMAVMGSLFYYINKLQASGTLDYENAINATGEVYLEVGKNRSRTGKVQINVQGALREMDAITDSDMNLKRGALVQVVSVIENGILIIKPIQ